MLLGSAFLVLVLSMVVPGAAAPAAGEKANPRVKLETSMGDIVLELFPDKAPKTVANFLEYVKSGHYDGTVFHRVIPGFMIQGGGFTADMGEKQHRAPIENEAANGLKNERGTIAMARTSDPHSASAQFFINVANNAPLNHRSKTLDGWGYAVFGKVVEGMNVADKIVAVPTTTHATGHQNVPKQPVTLKKATVVAGG